MADTPKKIQVRDRFFALLDSIRAEDGYHYTPDLVTKEPNEFIKGAGDIKYITHFDEPGSIVNHSGQVDETFFMAVRIRISSTNDPVAIAAKCLQDIRRVIDADSRNPSAGYLGGICLQAVMDESAEMFIEFADPCLVEYIQKFRCQITGADFAGL